MSPSSLIRASAVAVALVSTVPGIAAAQVSRDLSPTNRPVIQVRTDEARVIRFDSPIQALVVGNPSIADAIVHDGTTVVVTGRGFGTTNMLAIDRSGRVIADRQIEVAQPQSGILTVQRAGELETYMCAPQCRPTTTTGDANTFFVGAHQQNTQRNGLAREMVTGPSR